jgi:hypothetical protein
LFVNVIAEQLGSGCILVVNLMWSVLRRLRVQPARQLRVRDGG